MGCVWISDAEYDARVGPSDTTCDPLTWYIDADGDGYGDPDTVTEACVIPTGYVSNNADCDDGNPGLNPQTIWHIDSDGDGYGDAGTTSAACEQPAGYVVDDTDCDDTVATINPGAVEDCATSADDDCDGVTDVVDALNCTPYYSDNDRDGYGVGDPTCACDQPPDTATQGGDCDDTVDAAYPGAEEVCSDGIDNDCDGSPAADCLLPASLVAESDSQGGLLGVEASDFTGVRLAAAGDLMGSGQSTLMIANSREDTADGSEVGELYLYAGPVTGNVSLESSVQLTGTDAGAWFGYTPAAGDLDGDGQVDAVIGAPTSLAGTAFVFWGPITASGTDASADIEIAGPADLDRFAWSISAGDIDDDGQDDLIIGAFNNDSGGSNSGAAYLLRGPLTSTKPLGSAEVLFGSSGERAGVSVVAAGDVDGDGIGDVLVGASQTTNGASETGAVYLVRGPVSISALADASLVMRGEAAGGELGTSASAAGDLDGDGLDDMLIGAPTASVAHVVRWSGGRSDVLAHEAADATVVGPPGSGLGRAMVTVGDVDGDGAQDIAVGVPQGGVGGEAWLLYGPVSGTITGGDVTVTTAAEEAALGYALAAPGDISGDAAPDLFISASSDATAAPRAGAVWLLLGSGL